MKRVLMTLCLGALLVACGPPDPRVIYADGVDLDGDDDADDDTGDDDATQPTSYTLACTARAIADATTNRVKLWHNFNADQSWNGADWVTGTSLTWSGALDAARLAAEPCPHPARTDLPRPTNVCGYVFNAERDGTPAEPRYLLQGGSTSAASDFRQYVDCALDGPTSVPLTVDDRSSNNNGRNFHLNGS